MKKVFFILACVLVMGATLTSCDENKEYCWYCTYTMGTGDAGQVYMLASQTKMDSQKSAWEKAGYTDIKCQKKTSYKTVDECTAQNPK